MREWNILKESLRAAVLLMSVRLVSLATAWRTAVALWLLCLCATDAQALNRAQLTRQLLNEAQAALAADRLTAPLSDNAFDKFTAVLLLAPGNRTAAAGLDAIQLRYAQLIRSALQGNDLARARNLLGSAQAAFPSGQLWPDLSASLARATPVEPDNPNLIKLPPGPLEQRSDGVKQLLADVAQQVQAADLAVLIRARSDSEGRWIYGAMKEAVPGYRIRGDIRVVSAPAVELLPPLP